MHSTPSTLDLDFWSCIHLAVLNVTGKNKICDNMKGGIKSELEINSKGCQYFHRFTSVDAVR